MNLRGVFERAGRAVLNLPDRMLHKRRHLAVSRVLSQMNRPASILVVCHGNICRSPYLQAVLERLLPEVRVTSAGFAAPGRPVPPFSLIVGAQRGLDLSKFRSRPLVPASVRDVDLVIVMDARQADYMTNHLGVARWRIVVAGDLDPRPGATRAIQDPWKQPIEAYLTSFDRLDRVAAALVKYFSRPRR